MWEWMEEKIWKMENSVKCHTHTQHHFHSHRFLSFYNSVIFSYPYLVWAEGMELAMKVTKYESDLWTYLLYPSHTFVKKDSGKRRKREIRLEYLREIQVSDIVSVLGFCLIFFLFLGKIQDNMKMIILNFIYIWLKLENLSQGYSWWNKRISFLPTLC